MKVLALAPFSPVPPDFGGALRVFHVLRQLACHHELTLLGYGTAEQAEATRAAIGGGLREVRFLRPTFEARHRRLGQLYSTFTRHSFFHLSVVGRAFQRELDRALARERFDIVHTEFSHLGPFRVRGSALRVLDTHNVEYDNFRRMYETTVAPVRKAHYWLEFVKQKRDELAWCRMQDAVLATSERDAELFGRDLPEVPRHVVPNGVDCDYFTPKPGPTEPFSLVFTGMMAYVPNYDGVGWFLDEIFPLVLREVPQARLYVVGKNPPATLTSRASEQVIVTGTVPDVRPYVERATAVVVPLRMGGGTRLKIAEGLAMRRPIVTTRVGCEGIDVVDGEHALMADTPAEFARATVRLLRDAALRQRLAEAGASLARAFYDWSVIGDRLNALYRELHQRGPRPGRV